MKVLALLGTRPEVIKLAPVIRELRRRADARAWICDTGQHRELVPPLLRLFDLAADRRLDVMTDDQSPTGVASRGLERLEPVLRELQPDWIVVQGDTTSALAGALAGAYARIRVAHVEAGLRSGDRSRPFPEEINRRTIAALADLHCAPTDRARRNLLGEGIPESAIRVTGNPVVDALQDMAARPAPPEAKELIGEGPLILVTAHRRESFGEPFERTCRALRELAGRARVLFPVHPNPNVREPARRLLGGVPGIHLVDPLDYLTLVHVMKSASVILTDSGGIQEEAPSLGVPVLVLREVTERPEGVEAGVARLVGTDSAKIVEEALRALDAPRPSPEANPYGDGRAAARIVDALYGRR